MPLTVLLHGGGSSEGGGGTYVLAVARELERHGDRGLRWRLLVSKTLADRLEGLPVHLVRQPDIPAPARLLWEQIALWRPRPDEVLLAAGGFGPIARAGAFVLVAHNSLYFAGGLPGSGLRRLRLGAERRVAWASTRRARIVIAPSEAMADMIRRELGCPVRVAPFGPGLVEKARFPSGRYTFLHRTRWGPHKGFGVLLRAVRTLAERRPGMFRVRSACDPRSSFARSFASSESERDLLQDPLVKEHVELATFSLGSREQHELVGHAVVVPSATESFSFPLAEGLVFGFPLVAASRPYATELCGRAALYVPPGNSDALAAAMEKLIEGVRPPSPDPAHLRRLSWRTHVDALADACRAGEDPYSVRSRAS